MGEGGAVDPDRRLLLLPTALLLRLGLAAAALALTAWLLRP